MGEWVPCDPGLMDYDDNIALYNWTWLAGQMDVLTLERIYLVQLLVLFNIKTDTIWTVYVNWRKKEPSQNNEWNTINWIRVFFISLVSLI